MTKIDARGLSCPEPVILISRAMKSGESAYEIKVDKSHPFAYHRINTSE